jgi:hypothetical protein
MSKDPVKILSMKVCGQQVAKLEIYEKDYAAVSSGVFRAYYGWLHISNDLPRMSGIFYNVVELKAWAAGQILPITFTEL